MSKTLLFVGSASQGIKTITDTLSYIPLSLGMHVSSSQFYGSSPKKGAMGGDVVIGGDCQHYDVDFMVALSQEGLMHSESRICDKTILLYDDKEVDINKLKKKPQKEIGLDLKQIAQGRFANTAAMGAMLKLLGVDVADKSQMKNIIQSKFRGNIDEIMQGFDALDYNVSDMLNFSKKTGVKNDNSFYLIGNEAAVFGALAAGSNFFAGYPITPSSEAMHVAGMVSPMVGQSGFFQGSSEENSAGIMLGANVAGGKGWTATSGPGLDRMVEQLGWAAASKTPFVVYNVQRGGPSTGLATLTQTSDLLSAIYAAHGDYPISVLTPSTGQETYELMKLAFKIAWTYKMGVIVNSSKDVAQRRNVISLDMSDFDKAEFELNQLVKGHRLGSASNTDNLPTNQDAKAWLNRMFERFENDYDKLSLAEFVNIDVADKNSIYDSRNKQYSAFAKSGFEQAKIISAPEEVYITYGETSPVIKEALENENIGSRGLIALRSVYPFPISYINQLNDLGVKRVYVVENNRGVHVHGETGQLASKVRQYFKNDVVSLNKWDGTPMYPDKLSDYLS